MTLSSRNMFQSRKALVETLAEEISVRLTNAVEQNERAILLVSGGSTPKMLFEELSRSQIDWPWVTVIPVDERDVPADHERSNENFIRKFLLRNEAARANFIGLQDHDDGETANETLRRILPAPTVCLLGMGLDGHTASWFPGADLLEAATEPLSTRLVVPIQAPGVDERRFTVTWPVVARSEMLALHIEGSEKLEVLNKAEANGPNEAMPIRYLLNREEPSLDLYWAP